VDRAFLFRLSDDPSLLVNSHEWCADPADSQREKFQGLPRKALPWAWSRIASREVICVPRVAELPPEARAEKDMWESVGSKSLIILPLEAAGELLGALGIDSVRDEREWSDDLIALLGTVAEVLANALDRKRRDEALRESEERFRSLFENAPLGYQSLDENGDLIEVNETWCRVLGYTKEEVLGRNFSEFIHPNFREVFEENFPKFKSVGYILGVEFEMIRKDGAEIIVAFDGKIGHNDDGSFKQTHCVLSDITERKRAEEEKLALERQMRHAQKLESLGVLAGGIAHDFNNLLMGILGNADLALDALSPMSPARGSIEEIEKASKRAAELVNQMLTYSGKGGFVIEAIDLNEFVAEMAHLLEVSISKKAVLKYDFAADLPTFNGDATQIRQVVMNLITNASEALGDEGGVIALSTGAMYCDRAYLDDVNEVVRASLEESLPEGVYTYFEVADTGCGMDAETIERVFDPFFTTKFTGRGLGMSAVLGIVRGHKGALKIESDVGKGTTFKVLFPATEPAENGFAARRKAGAEEKDWRGSGTVLLVDDEEVVLEVVKRILEGMGFEVMCVNGGREALEVFRARGAEIACVLLDLTMPQLDGEQVFREIRRLRPDAKVILSSGYDESDITPRFAGEGLAGFIQKPYRSDSLRAKLREVLGG
jgi:PAS domain S-box-containing protein